MNPQISAELAALRIAELTPRGHRRSHRAPRATTVFRRSPGRTEAL
jgi:hypothetical protein